MDLLIKIDAELTLEQTKDRCEFEQKGGFQLTAVKFGTVIEENEVFPVNKAEFDLESSIKILDELTFISVGSQKPDDISKEMKSQGRTFICDSQIFVENKLTRVMVFGKNI
jgi:hypothetical protein